MDCKAKLKDAAEGLQKEQKSKKVSEASSRDPRL
jgi:hypothetical protein